MIGRRKIMRPGFAFWPGVADPVADELVASLARPSGDVTGTTFLGPELIAKRLQLLRDVVPGLSRAAALGHPHAYSERTMAGVLKEIEAAARTLGLQLQLVPADSQDDIAGAFAAIASLKLDALSVGIDALTQSKAETIVGLAAEHKLLTAYPAREFVEMGGLMSYGPSYPDLYYRAAGLIDKIFKGAKPGDLPVEQPTKLELVINLKIAKALGLTIPHSMLMLADEVIE